MFSESIFYLQNIIRLIKKCMEKGLKPYGNISYIKVLPQLEEMLKDMRLGLGSYQCRVIDEMGKGLFKASMFISEDSNKPRQMLDINVHNIKSANLLADICRKYNFIVDLVDQTLHFDKVQYIKMEKLEKAINSWIKLIENIDAPVSDLIEVKEDKSTAVVNVSDVVTIEANEINKPNEQRQHLIHRISNTVQPKSKIQIKEEILEFDPSHVYHSHSKNNNVFRLFAPYSKRNYACVSPELKKKLRVENPDALKDLIRMCSVGQVLGKSKGKKGFIIRGKPFVETATTSEENQKKSKKSKQTTEIQNKTLYIKGKNCKKDYRFFGESKVVEINGKNYNFFMINSWSPNHKTKAKNVSSKNDQKPQNQVHSKRVVK